MGLKDFLKKTADNYFDSYFLEKEERNKLVSKKIAENDLKGICIPKEIEQGPEKVDAPLKSQQKVQEESDQSSTMVDSKWMKNYPQTYYKPKKDVVIFVIENSPITLGYKNQIIGLVNKITQSNSECFFMMLRVGNEEKFYDVIDYSSLSPKGLFDEFFTDMQMLGKVDYLEALKHIEDFYTSSVVDFEYQRRKYIVKNINVIFVGSGCTSSSKEEVAQTIKKLKTIQRTKTIKYFCLEDSQTFNVAKMGIPVIGHIETDFYK